MGCLSMVLESWDPKAVPKIAAAVGDFDQVRAMVAAGQALPFNLYDEKNVVGGGALIPVNDEFGHDITVIAGTDGLGRCVRFLDDEVQRIAAASGIHGVRVWTVDDKIARLLQGQGFKEFKAPFGRRLFRKAV